MTNDNLPPLPYPAVAMGCDPGNGGKLFHLRAFSEQQMRDYGQACRDASIPESSWLPIDSAPKDGTFVRLFGCYAGATMPIEHLGFWSAEFECWAEQSNGMPPLLFDVTHWAPRGPIPPLPEPKP